MLLAALEGAAAHGAGDARTSGEVARVLADALSGGHGGAPGPGSLPDALLDALAGNPPGLAPANEALASQAFAAIASGDHGVAAFLASVHHPFALDALAVHHDVAPTA